MSSVTQRISQVDQPRGGYLNPRDFTEIFLDDGIELYSEENIHTSLVGLAVDYLTRFMMGTPAEEAFRISLAGSIIVEQEEAAREFLGKIKGLDDQSIVYACKLVGYDVCRRVGVAAYKPVEGINVDEKTIFNIQTMVRRTIVFWERFGPIIKSGFTFEGGYTPTVTKGDGDYLTKDTLWDLKVSKGKITNKHTLQLLLYYMLGHRSIHKEFLKVTKLGIYNPRLNVVYLLEISKINIMLRLEIAVKVLGVTLD